MGRIESFLVRPAMGLVLLACLLISVTGMTLTIFGGSSEVGCLKDRGLFEDRNTIKKI